MRRIVYLQDSARGLVVLADVGMGAAALRLPQDESTAAVRIGAILARNYGRRLPGEYRAVITAGDAAEPTVVAEVVENDPRVLLARDLLINIARGRDYTAEELSGVRQALIG